MTIPTPNGLLKSEFGDFENDPAGDNVATFVSNVNTSLDLLDPLISDVATLKIDVAKVKATGLTDGFLYGGTF